MDAKLTLADLVLSMRQRLFDAMDTNDQRTLSDLARAFSEMRDAAQTSRPAALLFDDLRYSAQHAMMEVRFKALAELPSEQEIRDILG